MMSRSRTRNRETVPAVALFTAAIVAAALIVSLVFVGRFAPDLVVSPAAAQDSEQAPSVPGPSNTLGGASDADLWRAVKSGEGATFSTTLPNTQSATLIQVNGSNWRALRNGPLSTYGGWGLLGIIAVLALFFLIRGRIRISEGWSDRTVQRFNLIERTGHWVLASSFILLALTGLNMLYGRYVLLPVIGPDAFATLTLGGKYIHNYVAFAFMVGVAWVFVLWVKDNIPTWTDVKWFAKGGGIVGHGHPDARRFNGGQKIIFWSVVLGGVSLSLSGVALMWPFTFSYFTDTFAVFNMVGIDISAMFGLPWDPPFSPMAEQQLNQLWHGVVALAMIVIIIAHIYIGTVGMEGAFAAMGDGDVDLNWAREHHNLWVRELERRGRIASPAASPSPAE